MNGLGRHGCPFGEIDFQKNYTFFNKKSKKAGLCFGWVAFGRKKRIINNKLTLTHHVVFVSKQVN